MSTAYGTARLCGLVAGCDKAAAKPLKAAMNVLLVLSALVTILPVAVVLYNKYKAIDASKPEKQKNKEIDTKKKYINIGMFTSIGLSLLSLGTSFYALPNVDKVVSCPAQ